MRVYPTSNYLILFKSYKFEGEYIVFRIFLKIRR